VVERGPLRQVGRLCREFAAAADELEATWGDAAAPALTLLRTAEGQLAHAHDDLPGGAGGAAVAEGRVGRRAVDARHEQHVLVEELTDRERSILRALPGPLTLREIGGELFLSLNTVKGCTKNLYRKLGVGGREEAVSRARAVGLP